MRIQLVVSVDCAPCRVAERNWREACATLDVPLEIVDLVSEEGQRLEALLDLRTLPAVVGDDRLLAVGVQSCDEAIGLLKAWAS